MEVYPLKFERKEIYDDPLAGVGLTYIDVKNPSDVITVYVYPIRRTRWDDRDHVIQDEIGAVLAEVDYVVSTGRYASRGEAVESVFSFAVNGKNYERHKGSTLCSIDNQ